MSNFNLDQAEVVEMNAFDMNQVDGGDALHYMLAAAILLLLL
ncbi:hypothetical protein CLV58_108162 [Spirosoma oryzae]|uniref:Uncharacterized protein n=1 Tax=Spirosoma oryzae TaxID=1469603 RepID=A0A2T0T0T0_9BACT|nr:hypothetical protein [Spirosoma oryzae]PRY39272.1 hypothetical protein CLV58_108162 [Spirosoma oryzae]